MRPDIIPPAGIVRFAFRHRCGIGAATFIPVNYQMIDNRSFLVDI